MDLDQVHKAYNRCAPMYDASTRLYPLAGLRFTSYRKRAIEQLQLRPGDHVLDLACGTGLNFEFFQTFVGPEGTVTGVDFSPRMLDRARLRTNRSGWGNVDLIQCDMQTVGVPAGVSAVFISGAIGFLPDAPAFVERILHDLPPGCSFGILDLQHPDRWPRWLFHLFFTLLGKPFAVTPDYVVHHPQAALERGLRNLQVTHHYGGAVYIATGQRAG